MPLSAAADLTLSAEQTDEVWLILLTLTHDDLGVDNPLRFVNNIEDIVSNGDTYIAFPFRLTLPTITPNGPGEVFLEIDNVDKRIVEGLRSITDGAIAVSLAVIIASDPDTVEFSLPDLVLREAQYDAEKVTGSLRFEDIVVKPIAESVTPDGFPGLF